MVTCHNTTGGRFAKILSSRDGATPDMAKLTVWLLDRITELESRDKWVSVADRLPPTGDSVEVLYDELATGRVYVGSCLFVTEYGTDENGFHYERTSDKRRWNCQPPLWWRPVRPRSLPGEKEVV